MYNVYIRVAPDQDLAGYPANFFAGYPESGQKNTKKNFYLNFELLITRSNISWKVNIEFYIVFFFVP